MCGSSTDKKSKKITEAEKEDITVLDVFIVIKY